MLARVSSSELTEWAAYERVHGPLGQSRDDIHIAMLLAMLHNQWAKKPKKPEAFLPVWDRPPETDEARRSRLRLWVEMMGGSHVDDR